MNIYKDSIYNYWCITTAIQKYLPNASPHINNTFNIDLNNFINDDNDINMKLNKTINIINQNTDYHIDLYTVINHNDLHNDVKINSIDNNEFYNWFK